MRRSLAQALTSSGPAKFQLPPQPKLKMLINSIVCSLTKESIEFMTRPKGKAALACIGSLLAHATSRLVVTDEVKLAICVSVEEAMAGLVDGFIESCKGRLMKVLRVVLCVGVVVAVAYSALLAVGLLLCLWRFTLFGLAQEKLLRYLHAFKFPYGRMFYTWQNVYIMHKRKLTRSVGP